MAGKIGPHRAELIEVELHGTPAQVRHFRRGIV
jgi:hypothetical protein